ncbi:MAG: secretin and TonB N-terminal domain-containing protein [bacterium]|nr:secretin and TonB N-terminal domain-containing protein [bacterium]
MRRKRHWSGWCAVVGPGVAVTVVLAPVMRAETVLEAIRAHTAQTTLVTETSMVATGGVSEVEGPRGEGVIVPASSRVMIEKEGSAAERISLNYKNGDLQNILRLIARVSGVNLVAGPDVSGTVTMELNDVHWEQALALVLSVNGYTYVREGNVIRVVRADKVEAEPLAVSIIPINFAKSDEIVPIITPLLTPERGKVQSDPRVNALIVTDIPAKLDQIQKVVERLDRPTPQVLIEAKFVEITAGDTDKEGVDWSNLDSYGLMLNELLYTFDREVTRERRMEGGARGVDIREFPITGGLPANKARRYSINETEAVTYQLEPDSFRLAFSLLLNNSRAKLISNPKLQTLDNKKAIIRVAETRYKPQFTYNRETGAYEINNYDEIYVGITLEVTPHVNYNGDITLDIVPEVSALVDNQMIQGVQVPITNVRRIETRVSLKDGHTVAVGGMIKDDWVTVKRSVPFMGDIPYLGPNLFTWESREKRAVNLVIFITPTVLKTEGTHERWQRQLREMHLTPEGEWNNVVTNAPHEEWLRMREELLVAQVTNEMERAEVR